MLLEFDLRRVTHAQVVEQIRKLEGDNMVTATLRHANQTLQMFYEPRSQIEMFPPSTLPGYLQFGTKLEAAVAEINQNRSPDVSITGAKSLGDQFRNALADIKLELASAGAEMTGAMDELQDTASQAKSMVKQVKAETADLKAALGLSSNNPPE